MPKLQTLCDFIETTLESDSYQDSAINGLQVEGKSEVGTIAFAVDAGSSIISQAIANKADMLIVHHGIFWGQAEALVGTLAAKLKLLYQADCSLYAQHLPLDGHIELGNGAGLARFLELEQVSPFCEYAGKTVGVRGSFRTQTPVNEVGNLLRKLGNSPEPLVLEFGPKTVQTVGVVTGSGSFAIKEVAKQGIDLLISGEPKHEAYHMAKELGVNAIFAGHYLTETFGVQALKQLLAEKFEVNTFFIDENTGI